MEWTAETLGQAIDYWRSRAVLAALELDLFTPLADRPHGPVELAALVDADPEALTFLLDALTGLGLLEKRDSVYEATDFARAHLVTGRPEYLGHRPLALARDWALWGRLARRIRRGRAYWRKGPIRGHSFLRDPDVLRDPLPGGHDVALVSYVLHGPGPRAARQILAAVHRALVPGGRLLLQEVILSEDRTRPARGALFALNLLLHTPNGRCYTRGKLTGMLEQAGFGEVRVVDEERVVAARKG